MDGAYKNPLKPYKWIGDKGEDKVAVPDYFFKIIAKQGSAGELDVLALLYHHKDIAKTSKVSGKKYSHHSYLTSVDKIEAVTGLDLFTTLRDEREEDFERLVSEHIW